MNVLQVKEEKEGAAPDAIALKLHSARNQIKSNLK